MQQCHHAQLQNSKVLITESNNKEDRSQSRHGLSLSLRFDDWTDPIRSIMTQYGEVTVRFLDQISGFRL